MATREVTVTHPEARFDDLVDQTDEQWDGGVLITHVNGTRYSEEASDTPVPFRVTVEGTEENLMEFADWVRQMWTEGSPDNS